MIESIFNYIVYLLACFFLGANYSLAAQYIEHRVLGIANIFLLFCLVAILYVKL